MRSTILLAASLLAISTAATFAQAAANGHAAPPGPFIYKSDGDLKALTTKPNTTAPVLGILSDHENYYVLVAGRTKTGDPEYHAHWIDYIVVQHGEGSLTYGGTDTAAKDTGDGELRGGTITGGKSVDIHPGDYLQIPAGVWHQISLRPGTTSFRYLVVKTRQ